MGRVFEHRVNQSHRLGLNGRHERVPLHLGEQQIVLLLRVLHVDLRQLLLHLDDLIGLDLDVGRLSRGAARRLMDHDAAVGQGVAQPRGTSGQQEGSH